MSVKNTELRIGKAAQRGHDSAKTIHFSRLLRRLTAPAPSSATREASSALKKPEERKLFVIEVREDRATN